MVGGGFTREPTNVRTTITSPGPPTPSQQPWVPAVLVVACPLTTYIFSIVTPESSSFGSRSSSLEYSSQVPGLLGHMLFSDDRRMRREAEVFRNGLPHGLYTALSTIKNLSSNSKKFAGRSNI